jgi:hypothetical protein
MHWRKQFADDKTIGSHDLEKDGKFVPVVVHIEKFYQGEIVGSMGKEQKVFAKLKEFAKPCIVNRTNFKRLETYFKTFEMNEFLNKPILLTVETVKSPEGLVPALRFSSRPLPQSKAKPVITDDKFPAALEAVKTGAMTIDKIKEMYEVTPAQLKALDEVQK